MIAIFYNMQVACAHGWANHGGPLQLEFNFRFIAGGVKRTHFIFVHCRVGQKTGVVTGQVVHKLRLRELSSVRETGICPLPGLRADVFSQILDCRLRRREGERTVSGGQSQK